MNAANTREAKKTIPVKVTKEVRERKVLLGLVAYFIKTGKAVGSEVLRELGFQDLSAATIRNYFASLEKEGFLRQQHTSGGRIPTDKALRLYAGYAIEELARKKFDEHKTYWPELEECKETKEVILYLQRMAETISNCTQTACFISAPRFDQDFIVDMRLVAFDQGRYLAVLLTDFGQIYTEMLHCSKELKGLQVQEIEAYFRARLCQIPGDVASIEPEVQEIAHRFYQEVMARYFVSYANFCEEDIFKAGFSVLLRYPELQDAAALASCLAIFENHATLKKLIHTAVKKDALKYWIGDDLMTYLNTPLNSTVVICPYKIGQKAVGALGIIGPVRLAYQELFACIYEASHVLSRTLTDTLMKYKISYRVPMAHGQELESKRHVQIFLTENCT